MSLFDDPRVVAAGKADDGCVVTENPATGVPIAAVRLDSLADYERAIGKECKIGRASCRERV